MNKQQLLAALESIGMRPGRGLGQNFLLDGNLLDSIVRLGAPGRGEVILEVGPGFGALTRRLLDSGAEVHAVEFDHRIAEYLRRNLVHERFFLTEDDACRVDYLKILPPGFCVMPCRRKHWPSCRTTGQIFRCCAPMTFPAFWGICC